MTLAPHLDQDAAANLSLASQVVLREREARDRTWWTEMRDCYHPDSVVSLSWYSGDGPRFVTRSQEMFAAGVVTRHRLAPPTVRVNADRALVHLGAVIESYPAVDGVELVLTAFSRLLYRLERRDNVWGIARLEAVYERDSVEALAHGQAFTIDPAELSGLRSSYRYLAWTLSRRGLAANPDLPGDDRPAFVDQVYADAFTWLQKPDSTTALAQSGLARP